MNIFPFIAWLVLTIVWGALNWLTYTQIYPVLSLRPVARYVFFIQLILSAIFLVISLLTIVGYAPAFFNIPSSPTTTTNGIY